MCQHARELISHGHGSDVEPHAFRHVLQCQCLPACRVQGFTNSNDGSANLTVRIVALIEI